VLLGVFLLGGVTAATILLYGCQARWLSLVTSTVFILSGAAVAAILLTDDRSFASDVLLLARISAQLVRGKVQAYS